VTAEQEAADAEREAAAIFDKINAAREHDGSIIPRGSEEDAERAADLLRKAQRLRAHAASPPSPPSPLPAPPLPPKKETPTMTKLPPNVLRAEKARCLSILAEAGRLGVSGDIVDAAIRGGTSVDDFIAENDVAGALAAEIVASAKVAAG
jgi:hypothetical protein